MINNLPLLVAGRIIQELLKEDYTGENFSIMAQLISDNSEINYTQ